VNTNRFWSSYRVRLPLSLSVSAILTAFCLALALGGQTLVNLRADQGRNASMLAHAWSEMLVQALRTEDVWLAYALLRGPEGAANFDAIWILVDVSGRIFASNRPRRYRLDQPLREALPWLEATPGQVETLEWVQGNQAEAQRLLRLPLFSDGTPVGELIALLSDTPYLPRFREILIGGILVTGAVLALLVPLGWLWGRRLVAPLIQLSQCMGRVGKEDPRRLHCTLPGDDSEIGQLGRQFAAMVAALAEQEALKERMLQTERLAAIGRVAAGVAHEVNNPLGGMLMAIDTYRQAQRPDARTARLLDLLERALSQIQGVVSALLVEARADPRPLTARDLDDVRTLAQPRLAKSGVRVIWHNAFDVATTLPAAPVRQLLLNLLLNAIEAARDGGVVQVRLLSKGDRLRLWVRNRGRPIPPDRLAQLFEPYPATPSARSGLGLWICYQIVSQLGGTIEVASKGELTTFHVSLPLDQSVGGEGP
jgi:Signal transduction histidine kinase